MISKTRFQLARCALVIAAFVVVAIPAVAQDRITLRPAATVGGNVVRVADVAEVAGPAAMGEVVVVKDLGSELGAGGAGVVVDLARVRAALEKDRTINWGRLTLSGVPCRVRAAAGGAEAGERAEDSARTVSDGPTLRDHVASWLARSYGCAPEELRVSFDESQGEVLDASTSGLAVSIRSLGASDKLSLAITTYRGDVIASSVTIRVTPLIRRDVAVAARRINRGEALSTEVLTRDEQWVPPSVNAMDAGSLGGVIARSRIEAGTIIRPEHVDQPIVVKKGEIVTVDCVSGGVVVRAMARAMTSARDGEVIAFQYLESKRSFNARVNGPGRAVLVAAPDQAGDATGEGLSARTRSSSQVRGKVAQVNGEHR